MSEKRKLASRPLPGSFEIKPKNPCPHKDEMPKPCYFSAEDVEAHAFYLKCDKYTMSIAVSKNEIWEYKKIKEKYYVYKIPNIQLHFPNKKEFRKWFTPGFPRLRGLHSEEVIIDEFLVDEEGES